MLWRVKMLLVGNIFSYSKELIDSILFSELLFCEHKFARLKGACTTMKENKLLSYISMLTPEQIDKIIDRLPRLYEEVLSQAPVSPPGQSEPTS